MDRIRINWNKTFELTWRLLVLVLALAIIVFVSGNWRRSDMGNRSTGELVFPEPGGGAGPSQAGEGWAGSRACILRLDSTNRAQRDGAVPEQLPSRP